MTWGEGTDHLLLAAGKGSATAFIAALFFAFFVGRFVIGWTRAVNSNWAAADATVELILLCLGVRRAVDATAAWRDVFDDHGYLLLVPGRVRSAPHVLESRRA